MWYERRRRVPNSLNTHPALSSVFAFSYACSDGKLGKCGMVHAVSALTFLTVVDPVGVVHSEVDFAQARHEGNLP